MSLRVTECKCSSWATLTNCCFLGGSVFLTQSFEWPLIQGLFVFDKMLPAFISCEICTKFHWENINFRPILISFLKWNFKSHVYTQIWIARSFWQEAIRSNSSLFYQTCGRAGGRIMQNLKWTIVYVYITACVQFMSFQHNNTAGLWGVGGKLKKTPLCFLCHKSTRPVCDKPW